MNNALVENNRQCFVASHHVRELLLVLHLDVESFLFGDASTRLIIEKSCCVLARLLDMPFLSPYESIVGRALSIVSYSSVHFKVYKT